MKPEQPQVIQMIYDIILGQSYVLKPMDYIDIKSINALYNIKTMHSKRQLQRQNNGQNR